MPHTIPIFEISTEKTIRGSLLAICPTQSASDDQESDYAENSWMFIEYKRGPLFTLITHVRRAVINFGTISCRCSERIILVCFDFGFGRLIPVTCCFAQVLNLTRSNEF